MALVETLIQDQNWWRMTAQLANSPQTQGTVTGMVTQSGLMVQAVLYLLFLFSVVSWGIIFCKLYQIRVARRASRRFRLAFGEHKNLASLYARSLEMSASPVAHVFSAGYQELMRLSPGTEFVSAEHATSSLENGKV